MPEQVAAELGISRSTLYRELLKHREGTAIERPADQAALPNLARG